MALGRANLGAQNEEDGQRREPKARKNGVELGMAV